MNSKFASIDKYSNDDIMHQNRFGKAKRLSDQTLNPSSQVTTQARELGRQGFQGIPF